MTAEIDRKLSALSYGPSTPTAKKILPQVASRTPSKFGRSAGQYLKNEKHRKTRFSDMGIPFLLDKRAHRMGVEQWISIDYEKSPHVMWAGRTGTGKTVGAKLLLARTILLALPELQPVEVTVIDPKEDIDFFSRWSAPF